MTFRGVTATATSWSATSITATVPTSATTGDVVVTVSGVPTGDGHTFTVTSTSSGPAITGVTPTQGPVGTSVTITGNNFGSSGSVQFAGVSASTSGWTSTSITASVPTGAATGDIVVNVSSVNSNGADFTVTGSGGSTTSDIYYYFGDALGSTRVITTKDGTVCYDADSYPYGGERAYADSCDPNYEFTGKERDSESGLDNFGKRYNSSQYGRFMSPDPIFYQVSMLADPQQWNEYAYVRNNPLSLVDPTGEAIELTCQDTGLDKCEAERQKELQALEDAVGKQAGAYLYENKVTTTDANGNSATNYYVGVYTNGPNGNGPAFQDINAVSNAIGGIISDSRVAELNVVPGGTTITSSSGGTAVIDAIGRGTPGATYIGQDGKLHVTLLDTSATAPGVLPPEYMSNNQPGTVNEGILGGHEFGHVQYQWSNWFSQLFGNSNSSAVRLENDVRRLQDPSAATRTKH